MKDILEYKGYKGIVISEESGSFSGEVIGLDKSMILFEGEDMDSLIQDFHNAVDDYLSMCEAHGREPEQPSETENRFADELTRLPKGLDDSVDYKAEALEEEYGGEPRLNPETLEAIEEGRRIADDDSVPMYKSAAELMQELFGSLPEDASLEEAKDEYFREKYGLGEEWGDEKSEKD